MKSSAPLCIGSISVGWDAEETSAYPIDQESGHLQNPYEGWDGLVTSKYPITSTRNKFFPLLVNPFPKRER